MILSAPATKPAPPPAMARAAAYPCALEAVVHHHGVGFVVTGWMLLPTQTVSLRAGLLVERHALDGGFRYGDRPDVPAAPGMRATGFEFRLAPGEARRLLDGPVTLMVADRHGGGTATRRLRPQRWAWEIETLGEHIVTGWAIDLLQPELPALLLLRAGTAVIPLAADDPRPDVSPAPGVTARGFVVDRRRLPVGDRQKAVQLCLGDALNPVVSLLVRQSGTRPPALGRLVARRATAQRAALADLIETEAKATDLACAPRAVLAPNFSPASQAFRASGFTRVPGAGRGATLWTADDAAVAAAPGLLLSPALAARARRALAAGGEAWHVSNGLRDLPVGQSGDDAAFPFLKPRLTPRLLAQAPDYAPLVIAPATAVAGWCPADGLAALHALLLDRLGPPEPLHEVLYSTSGRPFSGNVRVAPCRPRARTPLVSVVVPSRDNVGHLAKLLAGLAQLQADGGRIEVVIVDNASRADSTAAFLDWARTAHWVRVVRDRGDFNFSRLCNLGAQRARGSVLLFCNDDIEIRGDFNLAAMTALLDEPEVGIVGHTLVYEDGTIQHAGVVVGAYDAADNGQTAFTLAEGGYFGLARTTREVSAVTGAFLAIRRDSFQRLDGFNERDFAVSFNDVDLCLRARGNGLTVLNTCCGTVVHHESVSRAHSAGRREREFAEVAALRRIWNTVGYPDPYYSPGFDRHALPYTRPNWRLIGLPCPDWRPPPIHRPRDLPQLTVVD